MKYATTSQTTHCTKCGAGHVTEFRRSRFGRKLRICRKCYRKEEKITKTKQTTI